MGIEHFISIIDRPRIDKALSLSWRDFNRKYPRRKGGSQWTSVEEFLLFALDPPADASAVNEILAQRTLRWTMNRCSPRLFFMYEVIDHVPDLRARCLSYTPQHLSDLSIVQAVGAEALVRGDIGRATFFSILRFCERLDLGDAIDLKQSRFKEVVQAVKSWVPSMPPFDWLSNDYFGEGYACLNIPETKAVVRFLERAWEGKWPATHLSGWARGQLGFSKGVTPTARDSEVSGQILRWFRSPKRSGMCLVSYVEP